MSVLSRYEGAFRYANTDAALFDAVVEPLEVVGDVVGLKEDKATLLQTHMPSVVVDENGFVTNLVREGWPSAVVTHSASAWLSINYANGGDLFIVGATATRTLVLAAGTYIFDFRGGGGAGNIVNQYCRFNGVNQYWIPSSGATNMGGRYSVQGDFIATVAEGTVVTADIAIAQLGNSGRIAVRKID